MVEAAFNEVVERLTIYPIEPEANHRVPKGERQAAEG
jgi:hypothetical protein